MHIFAENIHEFFVSRINIYKGHVYSWNHDIFCCGITEIKYIVDHLFFFILNDAVFFTHINKSPQLMFSHGICFCVWINAKKNKYTCGDFIYNKYYGSKDNHKSVNYSGIGKGKLFGMDCCHVLGCDLTEDQDQQSQDTGCDSNIGIAQNFDSECGHKGRNRHIYNVVSY